MSIGTLPDDAYVSMDELRGKGVPPKPSSTFVTLDEMEREEQRRKRRKHKSSRHHRHHRESRSSRDASRDRAGSRRGHRPHRSSEESRRESSSRRRSSRKHRSSTERRGVRAINNEDDPGQGREGERGTDKKVRELADVEAAPALPEERRSPVDPAYQSENSSVGIAEPSVVPETPATPATLAECTSEESDDEEEDESVAESGPEGLMEVLTVADDVTPHAVFDPIIGESHFALILAMEGSMSPEWRRLSSKSSAGFEVFKMEAEGDTPLTLRTRAHYFFREWEPRQVFNLMFDPSLRMSWDTDYKKLNTVQVFPDNTEMIFSRYASSSRWTSDPVFLDYRKTVQTNDGCFIMVFLPASHPDYPEKMNGRCKTILSGFVVRPAHTAPSSLQPFMPARTRTVLSVVSQSVASSGVPDWVLRMLASKIESTVVDGCAKWYQKLSKALAIKCA